MKPQSVIAFSTRAPHLVAIALLLAFCSFVAIASPQTVHRWVDAQGHVHYGDAASAPAQAPVANIRVTAPPSGTKTPSKTEQAPNTPLIKPEAWAKDSHGRPIAPTADDACALAKRNKKALGNTDRPAVTYDSHGAAHLLSSKERQARLKAADQRIKQLCAHN